MCCPPDIRGHCDAQCNLPGGGAVRDGYLHAGAQPGQRDQQQRETPAHTLLQVSHQLFQKEQKLGSVRAVSKQKHDQNLRISNKTHSEPRG